MASLGKYCRGYRLRDLRAWPGWNECVSPITEDQPSLHDEDVVFIQEDYRVTRTIFLDQQMILAKTTPEWIAFCQDRLGFQVPAWTKGT